MFSVANLIYLTIYRLIKKNIHLTMYLTGSRTHTPQHTPTTCHAVHSFHKRFSLSMSSACLLIFPIAPHNWHWLTKCNVTLLKFQSTLFFLGSTFYAPDAQWKCPNNVQLLTDLLSILILFLCDEFSFKKLLKCFTNCFLALSAFFPLSHFNGMDFVGLLFSLMVGDCMLFP